MTLLSVVPYLQVAQGETQLPMPAFVYPIVALATFAVLGLVAWSYRDVANRHGDKTQGSASGNVPTGH